jgi:alpha-ketoglutarate-dependent taurine dioxygenase
MGRATPFEVTPLDATFGATVTGLRLAELDEAAMAALYATWLDYALLIFPGQHLDDGQQVSFARRFGELEFELVRIGNLDEAGRIMSPDEDVMRVHAGNLHWHSDSTYRPVQAKGAVFTARIVPPEGGETCWADMCAAWDALSPADQARIESMSAHHSFAYGQARAGLAPANKDAYGAKAMTQGVPLRPLVKTHPETGRRALCLGRHAYDVSGLDPDESERLLDELTAFACQPPRTWTHRWTCGDAVIWDNRCLMHRALPWDLGQPRDMRHTRLAGGESERAPLT